MNIGKPPLRKVNRHNAKARETQTNLWIFLRNMKWQPGNENENGIRWIELLALAEKKGIKMEEALKNKAKDKKAFAQKSIKQLLDRFKEETKYTIRNGCNEADEVFAKQQKAEREG